MIFCVASVVLGKVEYGRGETGGFDRGVIVMVCVCEREVVWMWFGRERVCV